MIWTAYICEVNFMENDFVRWLDGCCSGIASLEAEGGARRVAGDVEAFRDVMHEKAMLLAGMAREGEPHIVALPERMREKARLRLARFHRQRGKCPCSGFCILHECPALS